MTIFKQQTKIRTCVYTLSVWLWYLKTNFCSKRFYTIMPFLIRQWSQIVGPFFFNLIRTSKLLCFHHEKGEKSEEKNQVTAADFKYQCPTLVTVLICKETVPKSGIIPSWYFNTNQQREQDGIGEGAFRLPQAGGGSTPSSLFLPEVGELGFFQFFCILIFTPFLIFFMDLTL